MSILARPSAAAKSDRPRTPFGAGILEPEPKAIRVRDVKRPSPKPQPQPAPKPTPKVPAWVSAVRQYLKADGYSATDQLAAVAWIETRRCIDGCPVVSPADWGPVNGILKANAVPTARVLEIEAMLAADLDSIKVAPAPAASWPASTDRYRWTLSAVELANLDRRVPAYQPSADDAEAAASMFAPPVAAFRYEDTVSPADVDRMFSRDADYMLTVGAAG